MNNESNADENRNFMAFMWHTTFLALTVHLTSINAVIPSMILDAGGGAMELGIMTSIMVGGSSISQILFAAFLHGKKEKKKSLLLGINLRIIALFIMSLLLIGFTASQNSAGTLSWWIVAVFITISLFSFGGAFANVSYVSILGKTLSSNIRQKFFTRKAIITGIGMLISASIVKIVLNRMEYPDNYSLLFLMSGSFLAMASLGFWRLKERAEEKYIDKGIMAFFRKVPETIRGSRLLKQYLILANTLGISITLIPFYISYASKIIINFDSDTVGTYLILQVIGMISAGIFWNYMRKSRPGYKSLIFSSILIGVLIPLIAIMLSGHPNFFPVIFILTGIFLSTNTIGISGMLIEISDKEDRTMYVGIAGTGSIITAAYPILIGAYIGTIGYEIIFMVSSVLVATAFITYCMLVCPSDIRKAQS